MTKSLILHTLSILLPHYHKLSYKRPTALSSVHSVHSSHSLIMELNYNPTAHLANCPVKSASVRPFTACGICEINVLVYKPPAKRPIERILKEMKATKVVGGFIQRYFEDEVYQDFVVESVLCPHKFHMSCFVEKVRGKRRGLREWDCPWPTCSMSHSKPSEIIMRPRTALISGYYPSEEACKYFSSPFALHVSRNISLLFLLKLA